MSKLKSDIGSRDFTKPIENPQSKGPAQPPKRNPYTEELLKFIGKPCVVTDTNGKEYNGICKAIGINYINVVLMTDTEKIVIKTVSSIRRKRSSI